MMVDIDALTITLTVTTMFLICILIISEYLARKRCDYDIDIVKELKEESQRQREHERMKEVWNKYLSSEEEKLKMFNGYVLVDIGNGRAQLVKEDRLEIKLSGDISSKELEELKRLLIEQNNTVMGIDYRFTDGNSEHYILGDDNNIYLELKISGGWTLYTKI